MDSGFCSITNLNALFQEGYTFLQTLRVNANWIYEITLSLPKSKTKTKNRCQTKTAKEKTRILSQSLVNWCREPLPNRTPEARQKVVHFFALIDLSSGMYVGCGMSAISEMETFKEALAMPRQIDPTIHSLRLDNTLVHVKFSRFLIAPLRCIWFLTVTLLFCPYVDI